MRKILLATTAIVGLAIAGSAQAATTPLTVNLGGSVDVLASTFREKAAADSRAVDFETIYSVTIGVKGKANNGLEYGGDIALDNAPDISNWFGANNGSGTGLVMSSADVFMSGSFGKLTLGDTHGATDLALLAPLAGEGGVYGRYMDFLGTTTFAKTFIAGVDVTDHSTNITYFTPKVGNADNKVQAAVTYAPQFYNFGSNVVTSKSSTGLSPLTSFSPYKDVVKGAVAYTGNLHPVTLGVSADVIHGSASKFADAGSYAWTQGATGAVRDFTSFGVGAQAGYEGFTLGANYLDMGHYDTVVGQTKKQNEIGAGLKYEFGKATVGISYLGGKGYDNVVTAQTSTGTGSGLNYVKDFTSYAIGGNYAWVPGLTTNVDAVAFSQKTDTDTKDNGYVLLVSQKLAF